MLAEDSVTKQIREPFRRDRRMAGEQVTLLGEPVHEYAARVEPLGDEEASDEVNGKVLPEFLWDGQGLENAIRSMASRFVLLQVWQLRTKRSMSFRMEGQ